jgi:hypothetical protein
VNHPHRRGFSSGEIRGAGPGSGVFVMTAIGGVGPSAGAGVSWDAGVVVSGVAKTNGRAERGGGGPLPMLRRLGIRVLQPNSNWVPSSRD